MYEEWRLSQQVERPWAGIGWFGVAWRGRRVPKAWDKADGRARSALTCAGKSFISPINFKRRGQFEPGAAVPSLTLLL